jgi:hypothetical protein
MPAFTGAWKRASYYAVPEAVHVADPAHEARGQQDESAVTEPWTAERVNLPPALDYYVDTEADESVLISQGITIDRTDYMEAGHSHRGDHMEDLGAARAQNYTEKTIRGPGETYGFVSVPSFAPDNMQPTDENLRRGINSNPMNNPPLEMYDGKGFRYGTWEFAERGRLRALLSRVIRTDHGLRPLFPNTAYAPPARKDLRDVPLWASLARNVLQTEKRPMVRRTPPSIGEVLAEDGGPTIGDDASIISAGF